MGWSTDYVYFTTCTLVLCLVLINVQGDSPILILPNPIYYINQSITISCQPGVSSALISIDVTIQADGFNNVFECVRTLGVWHSTRQSNCTVHSLSGSVTVYVTTLMVEKMRSSTVTCTVNYYDSTLGSVPSRTVKRNAFSDAYVAPAMLEFYKFEFEDGVPVLNRTTRARCKSTGGSPPSEYTYEVKNKIDYLVYNITVKKDEDAEFVVDYSLKNGFTVTCRDKIHTRGEISLTKQDCEGTGTEWCLPRYISQKASGRQTVLFNPNYSNTMKCEVESQHAALITYSWTSNGVVIPSAAKSTYTIPANSSTTLVHETVSCTASLEKYGDVTITWNITWSFQATTTTAPGNSSSSTAIGVGVGVGVAVIIIAVFVGVILYKKERDNSLRYQNTASHPVSVTVDKQEKPTKKSSQHTGRYPQYPRVKTSNRISVYLRNISM